MDKELMELSTKIIDAIIAGKKDLSLLDGESYNRPVFSDAEWLMNDISKPQLNTREALCIAYHDFCDKDTYPFVTGSDRQSKYLDICKRYLDREIEWTKYGDSPQYFTTSERWRAGFGNKKR